MRWPHPCFVLLGSQRRRSSTRFLPHNSHQSVTQRFAIKSTNLQQTSINISSNKPLIIDEHKISPFLFDIMSESMDISSVQSSAAGSNPRRIKSGSVNGLEHDNNMDISSLPDSAMQEKDAASHKDSAIIKSVKEEEEQHSTAPLLHENHHSSLSNRSTAERNFDVADDIYMTSDSPTASSKTAPVYETIGSCRSIEEAAVNTTIEIDKMDDEIECPGKEDDNTAQTEETNDNQHHQNIKLRLTPEETRLFQLLTNAAEAYEAGTLSIDPNPNESSVSARGGFTKQQQQKHQQQRESSTAPSDADDITPTRASWLQPPPKVNRIEIRIAGGWVRDKILNQHSVDVDVALDCMMGVQFARIVQSYLALEQDSKEREKSMKNNHCDDMEILNDNNDIGDCSEGGKASDAKQAHIKILQQQDSIPSSSAKQNGNNNKKQKKKKKTPNKQPKIGVIGANPSQSKHLETATMNIHGIDIDFVNLRAEEVYELNSRIPTSDTRMFGTPLEDALRRDFTINSLFYNIRTNKVEDWTGRGLDDLVVHRRIVTPVDAHTTFHDDPLRILRAIRFAVRLDFILDDEIKQAAMSKRVHHSLHVKVSRERVGKELEGMLTGKHARPGRALDMIAELHLGGSVFAFPGSFPGDTDYSHGGPVTGHILGVPYNCSLGSDGTVEAIEKAAGQRAMGWEESTSLLSVLPKVMEGHIDEREDITRRQQTDTTVEGADDGDNVDDASSTLQLFTTVVDTRLLHLCVFILPFHNLTFPDKKGKLVSVTSQMIKESLKFPVRDIQAVSKILSHVDEMTTILSEIRSQQAAAQGSVGDTPFQLTPPCRLRAGLLIRSLKENWVTCLLTAAAWEMRSHQRLDNSIAETVAATSIPAEQPSSELYRVIIEDLNLDECWKIRPHLNGKEIIQELSLPKGPIVGVCLDDQTRWMLLNPEGSREKCKFHLQECLKRREDQASAANIGVANGDGHSSQGDNTGHFSKKIRAEI